MVPVEGVRGVKGVMGVAAEEMDMVSEVGFSGDVSDAMAFGAAASLKATKALGARVSPSKSSG